MATGYTYQELSDLGFYEWTLVSSRKATKEELKRDWKGCEHYEDCPCCNCGEKVVFVQKFARPRWSKSNKAVVEDYYIEWLCSEHAY